ncbi:STAS-like domain-containing protein [uncultured Xanthomonas sp.]|uniref:STAS-like domain-containing protein n=1 Tax=uncultured Xanthomonas sp. TaxID=152831 RepID=UPI0025CC576D|nr:STAS-like domain-containing protein [uncultured Xanthomonas sp.]
MSHLHNIVTKLGYQDFILDLSGCTKAYQSSLLSVCAQVMMHRESGVGVRVVPPIDRKLENLFTNANWGYFLDPATFRKSTFRGYTRIPAINYRTPEEQQSAVNRIVNVMLGAVPELERSDLAAFEWAVNEITDNVLVHSESPIGGLVQVATFERYRKRVQFVVADAGMGIPASLRSGRPDIGSDAEALDCAIREGVTRDVKIGQGNGMFGTYEICSKSQGDFLIDSGHARLKFNVGSGLSVGKQTIPYSGTFVVATVDFSDPELLAQALRFKGKVYAPVDYVELNYESDTAGNIIFRMIDECHSFGSRVSGKPVRLKLFNLLRMSNGNKVVVDFDGVPLLSSSFADEAIGKLFLQLGPVKFIQQVSFINMVETTAALVNRAIAQRMQVGMSDAD